MLRYLNYMEDSKMMKSVFVGWICRIWMETVEDGFISEIVKFNTEQEADQYGRLAMRQPFGKDEVYREFEVYKDFCLHEV